MEHPGVHALVLRKVANTLRDSVYAQYIWAIGTLGVSDYWDACKSPLELIYRPTGQCILFRGADDPMKLKSIKVPFGYIGVTRLEGSYFNVMGLPVQRINDELKALPPHPSHKGGE